jgi:hypothetical protein
MIHIDPIEPKDERWNEWRKDVDDAMKDLKSADDVDEDLYKGGREAIYNLFHGKCAYCELDLGAGQRLGDVEHFRPKGRVTDENYQLIYVDKQGKHAHPGYYWLAYDWTNLFPACLSCNRPGTEADGTKAGKWDRFPISGKRAIRKNDPLAPEEPLLLNPYVDEPRDHFIFDPDTGIMTGKTPRGEATIKILGLNREKLIENRKRMAKFAKDRYVEYIEATMKKREDERAQAKEEYRKFETGEAPFSATGREAIRIIRELARQAAEG